VLKFLGSLKASALKPTLKSVGDSVNSRGYGNNVGGFLKEKWVIAEPSPDIVRRKQLIGSMVWMIHRS
jgi:hypothetical protein